MRFQVLSFSFARHRLHVGEVIRPRCFRVTHDRSHNRDCPVVSSLFVAWNNELDAIRSCPTAAGCPAAPRGCPGTHLALHLATKVTTFVVDAMDGGAAGHGEL